MCFTQVCNEQLEKAKCFANSTKLTKQRYQRPHHRGRAQLHNCEGNCIQTRGHERDEINKDRRGKRNGYS